VFKKVVDDFERRFQGNGASPTNDCWRQKTRVSGLSYGVVCVILSLAILVQYRGEIDARTDRQTDT